MKISLDIDDLTVEEVRTSLSRYTPDGVPPTDMLVRAFLVYAARTGVSFNVEENLDENVDLFVRQ